MPQNRLFVIYAATRSLRLEVRRCINYFNFLFYLLLF